MTTFIDTALERIHESLKKKSGNASDAGVKAYALGKPNKFKHLSEVKLPISDHDFYVWSFEKRDFTTGWRNASQNSWWQKFRKITGFMLEEDIFCNSDTQWAYNYVRNHLDIKSGYEDGVRAYCTGKEEHCKKQIKMLLPVDATNWRLWRTEESEFLNGYSAASGSVGCVNLREIFVSMNTENISDDNA